VDRLLYKLREPLGGPWDAVEVTGRGYFGEGYEPVEHVVITPLCGFASPIALEASNLFASGYTTATPAEVEALQAAAAEREAKNAAIDPDRESPWSRS
jgi:hypothetical protein